MATPGSRNGTERAPNGAGTRQTLANSVPKLQIVAVLARSAHEIATKGTWSAQNTHKQVHKASPGQPRIASSTADNTLSGAQGVIAHR